MNDQDPITDDLMVEIAFEPSYAASHVLGFDCEFPAMLTQLAEVYHTGIETTGVACD